MRRVRRAKRPRRRKKRVGARTKELVDPTRPKGPKGAYMCFVSARRSQIKDANPDMTFPDIARELGVEWKTMSEASRHRYEQMAELDKDRYTREMLSYVPLSDEKMQELREQQSRRKAAGGLQVMYHCSPELTAFLGGAKTINRKELTTRIWKYFREHNLIGSNQQAIHCPRYEIVQAFEASRRRKIPCVHRQSLPQSALGEES